LLQFERLLADAPVEIAIVFAARVTGRT